MEYVFNLSAIDKSHSICQELSNNTNINTLIIKGCIHIEDIIIILNMLKNNKHIVQLNLSFCGISSDVVKIIFENLCHTNVEVLMLNDNFLIGDEGAHHISKYINNTNLRHLSISGCNIKQTGITDIINACSKNNNLKTLDLNYNSCHEKVNINELLIYNITLEKLYMYDVAICTLGFDEAIMHNQGLADLDISYYISKMDPDTFTCMKNILARNKHNIYCKHTSLCSRLCNYML